MGARDISEPYQVSAADFRYYQSESNSLMSIPAALLLLSCLQTPGVDSSRAVQAVQATAHDWKWWEVWGGSGFKMPAEGGEISAWVYFENDRMSMCSPNLTFCTSYIVNQDHDWVGGSNRKTPVAGTLDDLKSYLQAFDDSAARAGGVLRLPPAGQSPGAGGSPALSNHVRLDPPARKGSFHNVRVKVPAVERKPAETHAWASETLQSAAIAAVKHVQTPATVVIPRMDWRDQEAFVLVESQEAKQVVRIVRHGPMPWEWRFGGTITYDPQLAEFLRSQITRLQWARVPIP